MWRAAVGVAVLAASTAVFSAVDAPAQEQGYLHLGFDRLAGYRFDWPGGSASTGEEQIPPNVRAWNGRKAIVTGFMMPTKLEHGLATEFLLVRDPATCCYGVTPAMNEWIIVRMPKGMPPLMDVPISLWGVLRVGAVMDHGCLAGIYEFEAERMVVRKG